MVHACVPTGCTCDNNPVCVAHVPTAQWHPLEKGEVRNNIHEEHRIAGRNGKCGNEKMVFEMHTKTEGKGRVGQQTAISA